jgi:hypothetical protein
MGGKRAATRSGQLRWIDVRDLRFRVGLNAKEHTRTQANEIKDETTARAGVSADVTFRAV